MNEQSKKYAVCWENDCGPAQGYNLSVSTYVEAEDTREKIDIMKLNAEIEEIVLREDELRKAIRNIVEEIEAGA